MWKWKPSNWFTIPIARTVESGKVHCPVTFESLDVERCLGCALQAGLDIDDGGAVREIRCRLSYRDLGAFQEA